MDPEDLSLTGDAGSDDGDTIKDVLEGAGGVGPFDSHDEDSPDDHPTPIEMSNGTVTNRYREIMQQQHLDSSDVSSLAGSDVHGLPKRAGSPMESLMSGPDDSPSIQVRRGTFSPPLTLLTEYRAPSYLLLGAVYSPPSPPALA